MIVLYPDRRLRQKARPLVWNQAGEQIAHQLLNELAAAKNGLGLAGPQIGARRRLFAIKNLNSQGKPEQIELFINPQFRPLAEKVYPQRQDGQPFFEGCLSLPNLWGAVKRHLVIKARWQTVVEGKLRWRRAKLSGLKAIVFQHEFDHLDGILFIDHIRQAGGQVYRWQNRHWQPVPFPGAEEKLAA